MERKATFQKHKVIKENILGKCDRYAETWKRRECKSLIKAGERQIERQGEKQEER